MPDLNRNYHSFNPELLHNDNWHLSNNTIKSSAADLMGKSKNNNNHLSLLFQKNNVDNITGDAPLKHQLKACKGSNKATVKNNLISN